MCCDVEKWCFGGLKYMKSEVVYFTTRVITGEFRNGTLCPVCFERRHSDCLGWTNGMSAYLLIHSQNDIFCFDHDLRILLLTRAIPG